MPETARATGTAVIPRRAWQVGALPDPPDTEASVEEDPEAPYRSLRALPRAFLRAYRECGILRDAARAIGCTVQAHYKWLEREAGYPEALAFAEREVDALWEGVLGQRARDGIRDSRYGADGKLKDYRVREDARLLGLMLRARMPEKYGDNPPVQQVQVNVVFREE